MWVECVFGYEGRELQGGNHPEHQASLRGQCELDSSGLVRAGLRALSTPRPPAVLPRGPNMSQLRKLPYSQ